MTRHHDNADSPALFEMGDFGGERPAPTVPERTTQVPVPPRRAAEPSWGERYREENGAQRDLGGNVPDRAAMEALRQAENARQREVNRRGAAAVRAVGPLPKTNHDFARLRAANERREDPWGEKKQ